jgi:RHS repeat-associated protein
LINIKAPLENTTTFGYDDASQLTSIIDANNHVTQFIYDKYGRLIRTTYVDGSFIQQSYDRAGHILSRTDQAGKITYYSYDDAGRLQSIIDPLDHTTLYAYDEVNNLTVIKDANNHQTIFTYDELNRKIRKTWPNGSYEVFGYDLNGNLISHQLADGNTNTYTYDDLNRMTGTDYFDGQTVTFTYTLNSLRETVVDERGTTSYAYDNRDRLTQITRPGGEVVAYTYDKAGKRLSMITPADTISYVYDEASRLINVTSSLAGTATYVYDPLGLRTQLNLPNGITVDYDYDPLNRLTNINQHKGTTTLASYAYTLGPVGNRLSMTEADGSSIQWAYDDAYRLVSERRYDSSNTVTYNAHFEYDPVANRLSQNVNGLLIDFTYNNLDQLLTAGSTQYQYDGRGNLIRVNDGSNVTNYSWNAADRLVTVNNPSPTVQYTYDADGRRVRQGVDSQITNYLWDETSRYGDVVLEAGADGTVLASYMLGGTELLSQARAGNTSYYLHDGQNNVRALTDSTGNISDTYAYTAFGETYNQTGLSLSPYQYSDQQLDSLTGLYSLRARYYNPVDARFLSRDTVCCEIHDPKDLNRYLYTQSDPINNSDPSGHELVGTAKLYTIPQINMRAVALVAAGASCMYLRVVSVQMAVNHDRAGLLGLELSMPSPNLCHIPVLLYPAPATPAVAQHIQDAQSLGWPMLLHYLGPLNPRATINYNLACPPAVRKAMNAQGLWCDEYPFKTTAQGGAASHRGVPPWEQRIQGGILTAFYGTKLLFRPGAAFAVVVIPWRP